MQYYVYCKGMKIMKKAIAVRETLLKNKYKVRKVLRLSRSKNCFDMNDSIRNNRKKRIDSFKNF